jgi:zinc transporter ZupT
MPSPWRCLWAPDCCLPRYRSNSRPTLSGWPGRCRSYRYIFSLWTAVAIGAAVAIAIGYAAFGLLDRPWVPRLQAFGAGALLATTAETMTPEAFHNSPRFSGFLAALGFCLLLLLLLLVDSITS